MNYQERYDLWLAKAKDENILNELKNMSEEDKNLAFFKDIEFGNCWHERYHWSWQQLYEYL